tara:strand:- start:1212 stop:2018 length:807 start_codon:yes stop_codon:yes gene_type:complete
MLKQIVFVAFSVAILFSVQTVYAQENSHLPEGKNVKEWESISAALMKEQRYDQAIIYLNKIIEQEPDNLRALSNKAALLVQLYEFEKSLEISNKVLKIDPDRISTLQNKAIALENLGEWEKSFLTLTRIMILDPNNENIEIQRAKLLSKTPTAVTTNSQYDVHVLVTIRDKNDNLIAVTESNNARYLPSLLTESWWVKADELGLVSHLDSIEVFSDTKPLIPADDYLGMITLERPMKGFDVHIFEVFIPLLQIEEGDSGIVQWTITKN